MLLTESENYDDIFLYTNSLHVTNVVQKKILTWYANLQKHNITSENAFQGPFNFARNNTSSSH